MALALLSSKPFPISYIYNASIPIQQLSHSVTYPLTLTMGASYLKTMTQLAFFLETQSAMHVLEATSLQGQQSASVLRLGTGVDPKLCALVRDT